jgi:site-specific DNA recombinase
MRVIFYIRVSTLKDEQESSIPHQISFLDTYNKQLDGAVVDIIVDKISGKKKLEDREGTRKLLLLAEQRLFDALLVKSVSRVGRDTIENLILKRTLEAQNIKIIAVQEGLDTGANQDEFLYTLHSSLAQQYSDKLSKDVKNGLIEKAKTGGWCTPWVPTGYDWDGEKLVKNENGWKVETIQSMYLAGNGTRKISKATGLHATSITRILENPVYAGVVVYDGRVMTENGKHEPYRTKEQHEQILRLRKKRTTDSRGEPTYLLSGVTQCGYCNGPVYLKTQRSKIKGRVYEYSNYLCHRYHEEGTKVCTGVRIRKEHVEAQVMEFVTVHLLGNVNEIAAAAERLQHELEPQHNYSEELKAIEKKLSHITKLYMEQLKMKVADKLSDSMFDRVTEELRSEEEKLQEEKRRLESVKNSNQTSSSQFEEFKSMLKQAHRSFLTWTVDEQRRFLKDIVTVKVYKDKIDILPKFHPK